MAGRFARASRIAFPKENGRPSGTAVKPNEKECDLDGSASCLGGTTTAQQLSERDRQNQTDDRKKCADLRHGSHRRVKSGWQFAAGHLGERDSLNHPGVFDT